MGAALEWLGEDGCAAVARMLLTVEKEFPNGTMLVNCPFHGEETAGACRYNPAEDDLKCFGCQESGDLIAAFNVIAGKSADDPDGFREFRDRFAPEATLNRQAVVGEKLQRVRGWQPSEGRSTSSVWSSHATRFSVMCERELVENKTAQQWLLEKRGITLESAVMFRLGWNEKKQYRARKGWGLPPEFWSDGREKSLFLPPGLVIPHFVGDQCIRLRVRKPEGAPGKKYHLVAGGKNRPVTINPDSKVFVIVESELDGVLLAQETPGVGVCCMGAVAIRPDAEMHEKLKEAWAILVSLDVDEKPGAMSWWWWARTYSQAIRWPVPEGKDPTDYYLAGGDLWEWVRAGLPSGVRYRMDYRRNKVLDHIHAAERERAAQSDLRSQRDERFADVVRDLEREGDTEMIADMTAVRQMFRDLPIKLVPAKPGGRPVVEIDPEWGMSNPELVRSFSAVWSRCVECFEYYYPEFFGK